MRFAEITKRPRMTDQLARYLPDNYRVLAEDDGTIVIGGEDVAGWTLDGYVLPRLHTGLIFGHEVTEEFVKVAMGPLAEAVRAAAWPEAETIIRGDVYRDDVQFFEDRAVHAIEPSVTYIPFVSKDGRVGYLCQTEEKQTYIYFNPSTSDTNGLPNVFVYMGSENDPALDGSEHYYGMEELVQDPGEFKVAVIDEDTHSVVERFRTVAEAEAYIAQLARTEREKVNRGGYGIDAPEGSQ